MSYYKRAIAFFMCISLMISIVVIHPTLAHAQEEEPSSTTGDIYFEIAEGGNVEYSTDGSNWNMLPGDGIVHGSNWDNVTTVYLKATPDTGKRIDPNDNQCTLSDGTSSSSPISAESLKNGSYSFSYDSQKTYTVKIGFDTDPNYQGGNEDNEENNPPAITANGEVKFTVYNSDGGNAEYKIGDAGTWQTITNNMVLTSGDGEALTNNAVIYLKATPSSGYQLDNNNQQILRISNENDSSIGLDALAAGTYSFTYDASKGYEVQIAFDGASEQPQEQVKEGNYKVVIENSLEDFTPSIQLAFLDSSSNVIGSASTINSSVNETAIPTGASKIQIKSSSKNVQNARVRPANGTEIDIIDDLRSANEDNGNRTITVDIDASFGYEIFFQFSNQMNVSWSYSKEDSARDQYVEHAKIELVNEKGEPVKLGQTDWNLDIGKVYYFKLIPDYGYQIVGLRINNYVIEPQDSTGVFKFTMSASNFHFSGIVEPAENKVINNAETVGNAEINNYENNEIAGNLKLTVADAESIDTNALNAPNVNKEAEAFGTVDLTLDQIISKGKADDYWTDPLTDLNNPVQVALELPAGELEPGQTYSVVRNHNGTYTELKDSVYNATTGKLTFDTNQFSEYTIIKTPETPATEPDAPKPEKKPSPNHSKSGHTHHHKWTVVSEATADKTGIKEYRCDCGDVQGRTIIPSAVVYVQKFIDTLTKAPAKGTVKYDAKMMHTFTDYMIKKLAERNDVTVNILFNYKGKSYQLTIPAGIDYQSLLTDDTYFYGYFYFAQLTGSSIIEKK